MNIPFDLQDLTKTVQHNCDVADARYGADYTLCIYLLKMREYYRWESGAPVSASLSRDKVGAWLSAREARWEELEEAEFSDLDLCRQQIEPFESAAANQCLVDHGMVYSGGIGANGKPHFFLAELEKQEHHDGFTLLISGREMARDLASPPAMSQGNTIYVRREALRRMLWEKVDGWNWSKPKNAMSRALAQYRLEDDLEGSLDAMTESQIQTMVLHEIGEVQAGRLISDNPDAWGTMILDLQHTRAELLLRAVRDLIADCLSTLPALLETGKAADIHFFMAHLTPMRKQLFPELEQAYESWLETQLPDALMACAHQGREKWLLLARDCLRLHVQQGPEAANTIRERIEGLV